MHSVSIIFANVIYTTLNSATYVCVQLLEQTESLSLQVQQMTLDCNMHQQKNTVVQNQMRELQTERDQVSVCSQSCLS